MRSIKFLVLACLAATAICGTHILMLIPHRYGANYNFNRDQLESMGWQVTTTAVADTVQPCYGGLPWLAVDSVITDIDDISAFDAMAIMSATWRYQPDPYGDIISSPDAMDLVTQAVVTGIPFYAPCVAPRVLAAADLLDGVSMQGEPGDQGQFLAEYLAAGADYLGTHLPPVIFGNMVTATRGQYYQRQNCQAIGTAMFACGPFSDVAGSPAGLSSLNAPEDGTIWSKTYGGGDSDGATDIVACDDGGFAVCGYTWSFGSGNSDMLLLRADDQGSALWSVVFGGTGWERANSVTGTWDGGFIIAGYTTSQGNGLQDIMVVRTDGSGNMLWTKTFGGPGLDIAMSVLEDDSHNVLVCGYTESAGAGEDDVYLLKLDPDGDLIWERTYGGTALETGDCVIQTADGGYLVAGSTGSSTSNSDALLLKLDPDGETAWSQFYDGAGGEGGYDRANAVCECGSGFALAGDSNEPDLCGAMLVRVDQTGAEDFMEFYGGTFYDYGNDLIHCDDGGFIVCGATKDFQSCSNSMYAVKTNSEGIAVWEDTYGDTTGSQWGNCICRTSDGDYVIAGQTATAGAGSFDLWVVKIEDPMSRIGGSMRPERLQVIPNPASAQILVGNLLPAGESLRIFDLAGRCLMEKDCADEDCIVDVSSLPQGTYRLICGSAEAGTSFTVVR